MLAIRNVNIQKLSHNVFICTNTEVGKVTSKIKVYVPLLDLFSLCFELLSSCNNVDKIVSFAPVESKAAKYRRENRHTFKFQTQNQEAMTSQRPLFFKGKGYLKIIHFKNKEVVKCCSYYLQTCQRFYLTFYFYKNICFQS